MHKIIYISLSLLILLAIIFGVSREAKSSYVTHRDNEVSLQFQYPESYVLLDVPWEVPQEVSQPKFVKGYRMMLQSEYEELQASTEPRDGPPSISVLVFENPSSMGARGWVETYPSYSNVELIREDINSATLAGEEAVRYFRDGLYANEVVLVVRNEFVYMFSGDFIDEDSPLRRDYLRFLDSVQFLEP